MKNLIKIAKKISILVLVVSLFGCTDDEDNKYPVLEAGFTYTINIDTGTVTFINISTQATNYSWDFGDETSSNLINPVKTYPPGEYKVILKATNVAGASDTFEDIIVISDVGAPVITLIGSATINIPIGGTFTDPGATATDDEDGDITANIVVGGDTVDVNTAGTYIITYNVSDAAGNAATQRTRTVIVNEADPCVADTAQSFAASSFNISFETDPGTTETVGETDKLLLGDVGYEYLDNPDFDNAVNSSCKVAKIDKAGAAPYANVQIFTADKFNLTDNAGFKLKIFSPKVGTNVLFKLEDTNNGGINNQVSKLTTIANGWEELTFDFPESDTNKFDRIIIFFGFEQGDALTIHFDELKTYTRTSGGGGDCPAPPTGELLSNGDFEAGAVCWQLFAGTSISTTVSNGGSNSAEMQGATGVAVNFKQERFAIGVVQPNTSYTVSFDIIANGPFGDGGVFKAFTFSEGADGGSVPATLHVLTDNTTSLATTWETKTYTFTTAPNANQVEGGLSFLLEIVNSSAKLNVDNVVIKKTP